MTVHLIEDQTKYKLRVCGYLECSLVKIRDLFLPLDIVHILCIYKYIPAREALTKDRAAEGKKLWNIISSSLLTSKHDLTPDSLRS